MDDRTASLLTELRSAIDDVQAGSGDTRRLAELAGAVERRLRADAELTDEDDTLSEDIHEAAVRLEADHPRLASAVRRAADLLGGIGI